MIECCSHSLIAMAVIFSMKSYIFDHVGPDKSIIIRLKLSWKGWWSSFAVLCKADEFLSLWFKGWVALGT